MKQQNAWLAFGGLAIGVAFASTSAGFAQVTNFDDGNTNGWGVFGTNDGSQGDFYETTGGNPGGNDHFVQVDTFGVNFHNSTNSAVLGDYSRFGNNITLGLDVKVNSIDYSDFFSEVPRDLVVELVDNDNPENGYPYTSVWYNLGTISSANPGWVHYSVTIADPTSATLSAGWGGYGDEDSVGNPILPADRTFASVLSSVDEIRFTTYEPGYFYGFTAFDLQYDNAGIMVAPEPTSIAITSIAATSILARRRKR